MSNSPPPGYDDESAVPQARLLGLIDRIEEELLKTERVFRQHFPHEFRINEEIVSDFWLIQHSAEELGQSHVELVEVLILSYENFKAEPSEGTFEELLSSVRRLKIFLGG